MRRTLLAVSALLAAVPAQAALPVGAKAPDFATRGAVAGKVVNVRLAQVLKKGPVVLYFFPAAFTDGCNAEARAFAEKVDAFRAAGATVIGMSADSVADLQRFSASECAGRFAVASAGPRVIAGYDAKLGVQVKGRDVSARVSYVIGRDGRIVLAHAGRDPVEHVSATLASVQRLSR
ncbi:peroxiredoxin [Sphingomonas corticis]|jgi:peroxiredoxin|uniref:thioredoxin-dependent peroxiredoxin n=1 Tax=Sphingomonas corticis TaxID=2722791 RepID=A0ABX1CI56_9SPHN|nr:redoxin domain-containing protein [Sphingomonas corticis]NJR77685.1 redoxin domain-containing protein [Sphingomonas corticis]